MAIHLLIKGNVAQAHSAAADHRISLNQANANARNANETSARCASSYRDLVVRWFAEEPRQSPFPVGTLLFFSEGK